jgi:hypothetical protein
MKIVVLIGQEISSMMRKGKKATKSIPYLGWRGNSMLEMLVKEEVLTEARNENNKSNC